MQRNITEILKINSGECIIYIYIYILIFIYVYRSSRPSKKLKKPIFHYSGKNKNAKIKKTPRKLKKKQYSRILGKNLEKKKRKKKPKKKKKKKKQKPKKKKKKKKKKKIEKTKKLIKTKKPGLLEK